jgi:hypothetical protein
MMNESPGAVIDRQIKELGESLMDRTARLAADVSRCNAQIDSLKALVPWTFAIGIVCGLLFWALLCHIVLGAKW